MLDRIGYGIIGAGWILPNHAIAARHLRDQGVELTAIADIDAEHTGGFASTVILPCALDFASPTA